MVCGKGRYLYTDVSWYGVRLDILEVQKPCKEIAHTPGVPEMLVERVESMQNALEYLPPVLQ